MGEGREFTRAILLVLIMSSLVIIRLPFSEADNAPIMYVDPPLTMAKVGDDFSVNVTIANVTDLGGWEFKLYFNNTLTVSTATEGPFLKQGGPTAWFIVDFSNNYNATHGRVWLTSVLVGGGSGVTGSGTLATIAFHAAGSGNATLSLVDTVLGDSRANAITHTTNDGSVSVKETIDVAITSVKPLKTIVGQGYSMQINVTVKNQGDQTATFNVTTYANTTALDTTQNISMPKGSSTILTFTWNTIGWSKGNYTIWANAWPLPANSTLIDGSVLVTIPGDLNGDRTVDIYDAIILAGAFNSDPGKSNWKANADINGDGSVDIYDAIILAGHFGRSFT